jgi:hypothetical protein
VLPFGGRLEVVRPGSTTQVPLTLVPPFPMYPPETSWMRQPSSTLPALALNDRSDGGRVAYLAADIDRCFGRDYLPDHGLLLANLVRWAARDRVPLWIDGPGLLDCHLYRQADRLVLHVVNLTNPGAWRAPLYELIPIGPLQVHLQLPQGLGGRSAQLLVAGTTADAHLEDGWVRFEIPALLDHEVAVVP